MGNVFLIEGDRSALDKLVISIEKDSGENLNSYPDKLIFDTLNFTIEEARVLRDFSSKKSFRGRKFIFVVAERLTPEAQNALLKTLEELRDENALFIIIPSRHLLLPTLCSRCQIVSLKEEQKVSATEFLKLDLPSRLEFIHALAEHSDSENAVTSRRGQIKLLLSGLEVWVKDFAGKNPAAAETVLAALFLARRYLDDAASSPRIILEQVVFSLSQKIYN